MSKKLYAFLTFFLALTGLLELTALPSLEKEVWLPAVQDADALLFWGRSFIFKLLVAALRIGRLITITAK